MKGIFTIELTNKTKIIWKCERTGNKTIAKCGKRRHSQLNYYGPVSIVKDHNHIPEPEKLEPMIALSNMLERASI